MNRLHVQGYNGDIDIASAEDLWSEGGDYPFPAAAAATTIVSASANDTAAGTGARTVAVRGLGSDLGELNETVTLSGATPVTLANSFFRINQIEVLTAGSGGINAGALSVKHGATVIGSVEASMGRSRSAVFTPSTRFPAHRIKSISGAILDATAGTANFNLWTRKSGGAWQIRKTISVYGAAGTFVEVPVDIGLAAGEDVRLRADVTGDNSIVAGGFDIVYGSLSNVANV